MEQIKETAQSTWKEVDEFYKKITPKNEIVSKIEDAIHVSAHYLMMALTVVLVLIVYCFTRKVFATVVIVIPTVFVFFKDVHKKENEKKWMYYWLLFSFLTIFAPLLSRIKYFTFIKIAICYYFAFFDKDNYLQKGFEYLEGGLQKAGEKYMALCEEKRDWCVCWRLYGSVLKQELFSYNECIGK